MTNDDFWDICELAEGLRFIKNVNEWDRHKFDTVALSDEATSFFRFFVDAIDQIRIISNSRNWRYDPMEEKFFGVREYLDERGWKIPRQKDFIYWKDFLIDGRKGGLEMPDIFLKCILASLAFAKKEIGNSERLRAGAGVYVDLSGRERINSYERFDWANAR